MNETQENRTESSGMALSGMILGIIGLACAFIPAWRTIGLVIGLGGVLMSALNFAKAKKTKAPTTRSLIGLVCGLIGAAVACYFLYMKPAGPVAGQEALPTELVDTASAPDENALEKLKNITDSTNTQNP